MSLELRLPGESDAAFRERALRAATIARILVDACLANRCMQEYIEDPSIPYSVESVRKCPTVRIEYEQAVAIGDIGSCLAATKSKHWGEGPWIMPLEPEDVFFPDRVTYLYRENSLYNRRFEQRRRLKELLGKDHRRLVSDAMWTHGTKGLFLKRLTTDQAVAIRRILGIEPGDFWRACRGKVFLKLPPRFVQRELDFAD